MTPIPGSKEHDEFLRRARDPNSIEAKMLGKVMADSASQAQERLRAMLYQMIEIAPGRLFRDIAAFHQKFELEPTTDPNHRLPEDLLKFRVQCLNEEVQEYCDAVGYEVHNPGGESFSTVDPERFDAAAAFDAILDLVYFALGTAYIHRFPFNEGWARVQEANMAKVRAQRPEDSKRGSGWDVVKPPSWKHPVLDDLLDEACSQCQGAGTCSDLSMEPDDCGKCKGTGRTKRAAR
jgi:predicted HAD superfamily Cof-like phosphohydrolase